MVSKDLTSKQNQTSPAMISQINQQIPLDGMQSADRAAGNNGQIPQEHDSLVNDPDAIVTLEEVLNGLPDDNATVIHHHSSTLIGNGPSRNNHGRRRNWDRQRHSQINAEGPCALDVEDGSTTVVEVHNQPINVPIITITDYD